jgi:hypothetical protein
VGIRLLVTPVRAPRVNAYAERWVGRSACARRAPFGCCAAPPVEASSGTTVRHWLNRGGDRQANAALHRIVIVRLRWHQPTRGYMARWIAKGKLAPMTWHRTERDASNRFEADHGRLKAGPADAWVQPGPSRRVRDRRVCVRAEGSAGGYGLAVEELGADGWQSRWRAGRSDLVADGGGAAARLGSAGCNTSQPPGGVIPRLVSRAARTRTSVLSGQPVSPRGVAFY